MQFPGPAVARSEGLSELSLSNTYNTWQLLNSNRNYPLRRVRKADRNRKAYRAHDA